jgi:hypothetical protein
MKEPKMNDSDKQMDMNFFQLVLSLQVSAMQLMGKIASPITGKVERDLGQAKVSIDMLEMLSIKMKNNLSPEEDRFLSNILFELRMNYVDESKKPAVSSEPPTQSEPESPEKDYMP